MRLDVRYVIYKDTKGSNINRKRKIRGGKGKKISGHYYQESRVAE